MSVNHRFHTILGLVFYPFGIIFHTFFGIDFCIDFRRHFGCVLSPKWLQKLRQNQPKTAPKTHPKNHRKNDPDLQPMACATWSASWWDGKRIFWKAGRTFAASELCISANSSCSYLRSGLLPLPATATDTLHLLTHSTY